MPGVSTWEKVNIFVQSYFKSYFIGKVNLPVSNILRVDSKGDYGPSTITDKEVILIKNGRILSAVGGDRWPFLKYDH